MSSLARFFNNNGCFVAGYDAVETPLTKKLVEEGISIHYKDDLSLVNSAFFENKNSTLIVYTPAISIQHTELQHFIQNGFKVLKRAQILGLLSSNIKTVGIAGTHGKTTISALVAHILKQYNKLNAAFVGGILKNYNSNLILGNNDSDNWIVLEADEFDRSFLNLTPEISLISAVDADHLDIYQNKENVNSAFQEFIKKTSKIVIVNDDVGVQISENLDVYSYGTSVNSDFYVKNLRVQNNKQVFDIVYPNGQVRDVKILMPGSVNAENSTAAFAVAFLLGIEPKNIVNSLQNFLGVQRRFDLIFSNKNVVYINDYAHHPAEIEKLKDAVKTFYPNRKITVVFQPHLFTRTRDFAQGFADALNDFDNIIVLNIYPAREQPIEGVNSQIILDKISNKNKHLSSLNEFVNLLKNSDLDVLLTVGAGNIDTQIQTIKDYLIKKY